MITIKEWYSKEFPGEPNTLSEKTTFNDLAQAMFTPEVNIKSMLRTKDATVLNRVYTKLSQLYYIHINTVKKCVSQRGLASNIMKLYAEIKEETKNSKEFEEGDLF